MNIFVFGSNREGRHGAGAALLAKLSYRAVYGRSEGMQGNSYAIVTKELRYDHPPVMLEEVALGVSEFLAFANEHPDLTFIITPIGCGLAGFKPEQIAPMFTNAPVNCKLPKEFMTVLNLRSEQ